MQVCIARPTSSCNKILITRNRDREGTPKNLCDKDFAELSGAICLKTLVLLGECT